MTMRRELLNDCYVVDKDTYEKEHELAELNEKQIKEIAEKKYLDWIHNDEIKIEIDYGTVKDVLYKQNIVTTRAPYDCISPDMEINQTLLTHFAWGIADEAEKQLAGWKETVRNTFEEYKRRYFSTLQKKLDNWRITSLCLFSLVIIETIVIITSIL